MRGHEFEHLDQVMGSEARRLLLARHIARGLAPHLSEGVREALAHDIEAHLACVADALRHPYRYVGQSLPATEQDDGYVRAAAPRLLAMATPATRARLALELRDSRETWLEPYRAAIARLMRAGDDP